MPPLPVENRFSNISQHLAIQLILVSTPSSAANITPFDYRWPDFTVSTAILRLGPLEFDRLPFCLNQFSRLNSFLAGRWIPTPIVWGYAGTGAGCISEQGCDILLHGLPADDESYGTSVLGFYIKVAAAPAYPYPGRPTCKSCEGPFTKIYRSLDQLQPACRKR
jgi:hypothetical protein